MISTKERALLKSKSHALSDIVFIGKDGLTDNIIKQIETNLYAHEMIKIKIQQASDVVPYDIAGVISEKVGCEIVGVVGRKVILYKKTTKEGFKHYL